MLPSVANNVTWPTSSGWLPAVTVTFTLLHGLSEWGVFEPQPAQATDAASQTRANRQCKGLFFSFHMMACTRSPVASYNAAVFLAAQALQRLEGYRLGEESHRAVSQHHMDAARVE